MNGASKSASTNTTNPRLAVLNYRAHPAPLRHSAADRAIPDRNSKSPPCLLQFQSEQVVVAERGVNIKSRPRNFEIEEREDNALHGNGLMSEETLRAWVDVGGRSLRVFRA
jgi:hypothetical protein